MPMGWGASARYVPELHPAARGLAHAFRDIYTLTCMNRKCSFLGHLRIFVKGQLKSRKFSLFLQSQADFTLKTLGIHKGFPRAFALNPLCACETGVIFFVFSYTLICFNCFYRRGML